MTEAVAAPTLAQASPMLPDKIVVDVMDLEKINWIAIHAVRQLNFEDGARIFIRAGGLVRISEDEDGRPIVDRMDEFAVRYELTRAIRWVRTKNVRDKDGETKTVEIPVPPPMDAVRDFMKSPTTEFDFPALRGVIETPTMRPDGSVLDAEGYDVATGLFYKPTAGLAIPRLPPEPTVEQVQSAVDLLNEVVCDFPFVDQSSRANMLAALITPVIRPMIDGPVPLALLDKTVAGTGASLLAEVVSGVVLGRDASMQTAPTDEAEWRKKILTQLLAGRGVVIIDNIEGKLQSPTLASVLTSMTYEDRILGRSETVVLPHRCCWIGTGINIQLGGDIPRRCFWIRMDPNSARPWQRKKPFVHPNLKEWVREKRSEIVFAILLLAWAWIRAGRPVPKKKLLLGGYDQWLTTLSGILSFAGVEGFLENLAEMYDEADADGPQWAAFVDRWYSIWKEDPVTVAKIVDHIRAEGMHTDLDDQLMSVVPDEVVEAWSKPGASFARKLGDCLRHRSGRVFPNGYRLVKAGVSHQAVLWSMKKVEEEPEPTEGGESSVLYVENPAEAES